MDSKEIIISRIKSDQEIRFDIETPYGVSRFSVWKTDEEDDPVGTDRFWVEETWIPMTQNGLSDWPFYKNYKTKGSELLKLIEALDETWFCLKNNFTILSYNN